MMNRLLLPLLVTLAIGPSAFAGEKPPKKTKALLARGKALFAANCVACHGAGGDGDGPAAVALNPKPRSFVRDALKQGRKPKQVFSTISKGIAGSPMVGYAHLPEDDRWALVHYVLSLRARDGRAKDSPAKKPRG